MGYRVGRRGHPVYFSTVVVVPVEMAALEGIALGQLSIIKLRTY
jgi:hypothetical protein